MLVTGIIASPRKGMNTDILVKAVLEGCRDGGATTECIYLDDLDIRPCMNCKEQDGMGCVVCDGMETVYRAMESADGLVLGTPVYYNSVSSQMKLMVDRCYCMAMPVILPSGKRVYESAVKKNKKGLVVSVGGSGTNPGCVLPIFEIWSLEVNLKIVDSILVSRALLGKTPMESEELLKEALLKGREFARQIWDPGLE